MNKIYLNNKESNGLKSYDFDNHANQLQGIFKQFIFFHVNNIE